MPVLSLAPAWYIGRLLLGGITNPILTGQALGKAIENRLIALGFIDV